jgi:predicted ABC-type ATPase
VLVLTVVAGPNGSGKSTLTKALDFDGRENLLDPDAIARGRNPSNPRSVALTAGREILQRIQDYLDQRISFAIETTLASKRTLGMMEKAKVRGFNVQLVYIGLDTPERGVLRVQERVYKVAMMFPMKTSVVDTSVVWQIYP